MNPPVIPIEVAALAFCISLLGAWVVRPVLEGLGVLDRPNARSSHARSTVRGGGIAIVAAVCLSAGLLIRPGSPARIEEILGAAAVLAAVSLVDDVRSLPALVRLGWQFAAASAGLLALAGASLHGGLLPGQGSEVARALAGLLGLIWVVGYANAFNFMDGINGIAAGQALLSSLGMAGVALGAGGRWTSAPILLCLAVAGAAGGFLPHNFPRARMFMGDVGSAPLGFLLAILVLWLAKDLGGWLLAPLVLLHANFVLDTAITLVRRALRGERWYEAHREHFYQRFIRSGRSHSWVTLWEMGIECGAIFVVWATFRGSTGVRWGAAAVVLAAWLGFFLVAEAGFRRSLRA
jgi:UDP-N-acetylmuramyl pentapeptide phosphotransferase/UDP-N-acetylglucosamine-1-phosphate transferase